MIVLAGNTEAKFGKDPSGKSYFYEVIINGEDSYYEDGFKTQKEAIAEVVKIAIHFGKIRNVFESL